MTDVEIEFESTVEATLAKAGAALRGLASVPAPP
jgi:hypothetical protein